jgi:hypothetical protein
MILSQEQWMELRALRRWPTPGRPGRRSPGRPGMTGAPSSATCLRTRRPRRRTPGNQDGKPRLCTERCRPVVAFGPALANAIVCRRPVRRTGAATAGTAPSGPPMATYWRRPLAAAGRGGVELVVVHSRQKRSPLAFGEGQCRPRRVPRLTHQDGFCDKGYLDAVAALAEGALTPQRVH